MVILVTVALGLDRACAFPWGLKGDGGEKEFRVLFLFFVTRVTFSTMWSDRDLAWE